MLILLHKGVPKKIMKSFLIEDFFHFPLVSTTLVVHLELRISLQILEKFEMAIMVYSGAWGIRIHKKNLKSKILWHCPFNAAVFYKDLFYRKRLSLSYMYCIEGPNNKWKCSE